jgi:hypothetical protein
VEAQQWFWPWGRMESFHAGYYLSGQSNLQADAGVCFVGVEVGAGSGGSAVVLAIGTDGKLSGW